MVDENTRWLAREGTSRPNSAGFYSDVYLYIAMCTCI
jgi:hypothetical protein